MTEAEKRTEIVTLRFTPTEMDEIKTRLASRQADNLSALIRDDVLTANANTQNNRRTSFHAEHAAEVERGDRVELGRFRNRYGEEYVMWASTVIPMVFVAGDETAWEALAYTREEGHMCEPFSPSAGEVQEMQAIVARAGLQWDSQKPGGLLTGLEGTWRSV